MLSVPPNTSEEFEGSIGVAFGALELRRTALVWPEPGSLDESLDERRSEDLDLSCEDLVTGGSFEGDLGSLWPEAWYFLGGGAFDEDSVVDAESRSRREEVDVLERRGAFEVLGNLGDAALDTSGEFMLILACYGQSLIVWTTC
jgi:hypothetical protein